MFPELLVATATLTSSVGAQGGDPVTVAVNDASCVSVSAEAVGSMVAAELDAAQAPMPSHIEVWCTGPTAHILVRRKASDLERRTIELESKPGLTNSRTIALLAAETLEAAWQDSLSPTAAPPPPPPPVVRVEPAPVPPPVLGWTLSIGGQVQTFRRGGPSFGPSLGASYRHRWLYGAATLSLGWGGQDGLLGRVDHRSLSGTAEAGVFYSLSPVSVALGVGARVARSWLDGEAAREGVVASSVAVTHAGPFVAASVDWIVTEPFFVGLRAELGTPLRSARIFADDVPVFENRGLWTAFQLGPGLTF